ncbi:MAG: hypothetical protein GF334_04995 [Candidatus Altiarchaeales archaeon]|nr:hypothetical protein [Candidatus Altiarchaeales archaeon]
MEKRKRERIIEKLEKLADPARNPNMEEVEAAKRKIEELSAQDRVVLELVLGEDGPLSNFSEEERNQKVKEALEKLMEGHGIDFSQISITSSRIA